MLARTKLAFYPMMKMLIKGACVGIQGARIKQINNALNNERIDIFTWKNNPVDLIAEA